MDTRRAAPYNSISVIKYVGSAEEKHKPIEINDIDPRFTDATCNKENMNFGDSNTENEKLIDHRILKDALLYKNNVNGIQNWSQEAYNLASFPYPIYCPSSKIITNPPPCSSNNIPSVSIELNTSITDHEVAQQINLPSETKNGIQLLIDAIYFLDKLPINDKPIDNHSENLPKVGSRKFIRNGFRSHFEPYTDNLVMLANVAVKLIDEESKNKISSMPNQVQAGPVKLQQKENKTRKLKSALWTRSYNKRLSNITSNLKLHLKPKQSVKGPKLRINGVVL